MRIDIRPTTSEVKMCETRPRSGSRLRRRRGQRPLRDRGSMNPAERLTVLEEAQAARSAHDQIRRLAALANTNCRRAALAILVAFVVVSCDSNPTAPPPDPPVLTAPVNEQILDNGCPDCSDPMRWEFTWAEVPAATQYHLYVIAESATGPIINEQAVPFSHYLHTSQGYAGPGPWTWRVKVLVKGKWSGWGETRTFGVEPPCQDCSPTPSSP